MIVRPRTAAVLPALAAAALLVLTGCMGGGGSGGAAAGGAPPQPPTQPPPQPRARRRPAPEPTARLLHIAAMHITQGTQTLNGEVPLVKGRDGCLRVFVLSRSWSGPGPAVRVHVRDAHGHELLARDILPPGQGVPSSLREGAPGESWDLPLPGNLIQPGHTIQAELAVPEGDPVLEPGQRSFPHDGQPLAMNVRPVPTLGLTLVPIRTHGRVGRIDEGGRSRESWVADLRSLYPLADIDLNVAPAFATDQDFSSDADVFPTVLTELEAWRLADGRNDDRYFYGVIPGDGPSGNGTLGIGFIGRAGSKLSRTAIGLDGIHQENPQYSYHNVLAHELGHTFGRRHTPCGVSGTDPNYPEPDGYLDVCGFDLRTHRPVDPEVATDIMGYCRDRWVSRYTYEAVLNYRELDGQVWNLRGGRTALAAKAARDCLLVWGRGEGSRMELTAALRVHRRPLPPTPGDYSLEMVDGAGRVVKAVAFAPAVVGDQAGATGFTLVVPLPPGGDAGLAELRVTHEGQVRAVLRPSGHAGRTSPGPKAVRGAGGVVHFTWDAASFPRVLVQDGPGGATLALGTGGSLDLEPRSKVLDCTFSDGLHSIHHPVRVE